MSDNVLQIIQAPPANIIEIISQGAQGIPGPQGPAGSNASVSIGMSDLGNSAGTSGIVSGSNVQYLFAGGNNITLSQSLNGRSGSLSIIGGNAGVSFSGGGSSAALGSLVFSNSNGVSFGLNGSTLTASAAGAVSFSAGTSSSPLASLVFSNASGVQFGLDGSTITASVKTDYQTSGNYLTTAMQSNAATISNVNISAGSTSNNLSHFVFSNGSGVTFGLDGSTITASVVVPAGAQTGISGISGGTTQMTSGTALFADSNGVSFGVDGNTITATVKTDYQTSGAYLTTAMQSNAVTLSNIQMSAGTLTALRSDFTFSNSNGLSFGLDTNGVFTGTVKTDYQASGAYLTSQSNQALSAGNGSFAFQTATFADSNGVSFSTGTQGIFATVKTDYQASGAYLTTAALSQDSSKYIQNWKLTGNSSGTGSSAAGSDLWLAGGNGVTLSGSSNSISFSVATNYQSQGAYLTTAMQSNAATISNINISASNTSANLSNLVFSNSNGISFGLSGSTITGTVKTDYQTSGAYLTTAALSGDTSKYIQEWQLTGNSAGTGSSAQGSRLYLSGGANITLSGNSNTIVISGPAAASINVSAGTTSSGLNSVVFSNSNQFSFGLSGSTVTGSVPGTSSLSATGLVSISANANTISIGVPQTYLSSYENMNNGLANSSVFTFNGASQSHAVAFILPQHMSASFIRIPALMTIQSTSIAVIASNTATAQCGQFSTWNAVVYSLGTGASSKSLQSVTSSGNSWSFTAQISITSSSRASYSLGLSGHMEGSALNRSTQYSISNLNSYSFTTDAFTDYSSNRMLDIDFANSLTPGNYWLVLGYSSSSSSAGAVGLAGMTNCFIKYSNHYGGSGADLSFGVLGTANQTSGGLMGAGSFSTAGGGTTSGMPISAISSNASNARIYFQMLRSN